jgi:hypothetical protein
MKEVEHVRILVLPNNSTRNTANWGLAGFEGVSKNAATLCEKLIRKLQRRYDVKTAA